MAQRDGNDDSDGGGGLTAFEQSLFQYDGELVPEPQVGIEFMSEDAAKMFYEEYARCLGFSIRFNHYSGSKLGGKATSIEFSCSSDGMNKKTTEKCGAMLKIKLSGEKKWIVTKFVKEHNHPVVSPREQHSVKPRRPFTCPINNVAKTYQGVEAVPSGVMYVSVNENQVSSETNGVAKNMPVPGSNNAYNNIQSGVQTPICPSRKRTFGRDAQNLLDYFKRMQAENPGFYYAIQLDEENRMANAFWADARSRTAYSHFGDAVNLDTMYRINQSRVPFAPFTGVNHHGQTILFGCALLLDESEATFVWLLKTFLAAMGDRPPVSLTTDNDRVLQAAVRQVFPEARHCVSKWHVLREGQERMARVCLAHPSFQVELYNCINKTWTIEEFESCWESILDKYDLRRNDWLQSIYDARRQWVPVYFRDSFFATITPSMGAEGSFFDGYVNEQTTLPLFFRQYERALENSFEREAEADSETKCTMPVLMTPSPMEKQAADLYTKIIFSKFQEELVETFVYTANRISGDGINSTFRVAKFEDDNKAYDVSLNIAEMKAGCSCQMFEYSGIICRHVLTVFAVSSILTLPSHYILTRWTRNAKSVSLYDECSELQIHGSVTTRYNNICKEAIRFSEEAAITSETYSAALASLREACKKIAGVKETAVSVLLSSSQRNGVGNGNGKTSTETPETPLLWPQQSEMRQFNLNDNGLPSHPVSNFNIPRMAPVSLSDNHNDKMVVLPCLKSMTWGMQNKDSAPAYRTAVINLKLQDNSRTRVVESDVKFSLSKVTMEPMLKSMAYISEQLSTPANNVAIINLKLQDSETTSGASEVKFQVSRDTLGALLRSMAYIREQLSIVVEPKQDSRLKRQRK